MGIIIFLFGCIVVSLFLVLYVPILKKSLKQNQQLNTEDDLIKSALSIVQSEQENATPEKKANAFVSLILNSYVLVHTMVNEGNKYDDVVQKKHFKNSLTPDIIKKLNELEKYNG